MAEDTKKPIVAETIRKAVKKEYKVKKEFTLDKLYMPGNVVLLEEGELKETLISNKFI